MASKNGSKVKTLNKTLKSKSKVVAKGKSKKVNQETDNSFTLTGISAVKIVLSQYVKNRKKIEEYEDDEGDLPLTLVSPEEDDIPIMDILHERSKRAYYFLDARKTQIKVWPNMVDVTLAGPLPSSTTKLCWWDRHSFQNRPLGCPLRCISDKEHKEKDIYETEGIFCGFPCCKAYIISQKSEMKYKESLALLTMIFMTFYGKRDISIPIAPTWKMLKAYGGHLTIQEYKSSIGRLDYEETVNFKRSQLVCSSQYIQEKRSKDDKTVIPETKGFKKN